MTRALGRTSTRRWRSAASALAVEPDDAATTDIARLLGVLHNERGEILDNLGSTAEARALFETYRQQALLDNDQSHLAWALDQPGAERRATEARTRWPAS